MPESTTTTMRDSEARRALKDDLARLHCRVHQAEDPPLFTREPRSTMEPVHWRWRDLSPMLDRLGALIEIGSGGQRRTLRLANPGLAYGTTPTFWASIQVILPGEIADAHRHSASALRFIMQGQGSHTTVDGERYPMHEGDVVLTPAWTFHDHEHRGDRPMIWLDVLDISLMRALHATFFEGYPQREQPLLEVPDHGFRAFGSGVMRPPRTGAERAVNPLLAYPRERAEAALEQAGGLAPDPVDDVILEYQNPLTGGPVMTTMSLALQKLRPGFVGRARRHTGSKLYYAVRGSGTTSVAGQRFAWSAGDFIAVPPWAWCAHCNDGVVDALLFRVDDTPTLRTLGYWREETSDDDASSPVAKRP